MLDNPSDPHPGWTEVREVNIVVGEEEVQVTAAASQPVATTELTLFMLHLCCCVCAVVFVLLRLFCFASMGLRMWVAHSSRSQRQ